MGAADDGRRSTALELASLLRFPGAAALIMVLPAVGIGPLAFAWRDDFSFSRSDIGATFAMFFLSSAVVAGAGSGLVRRVRPMLAVRVGLVATSAVLVAMSFANDSAVIYVAVLFGGAVNGLTPWR